jgi:hypothetical protein
MNPIYEITVPPPAPGEVISDHEPEAYRVYRVKSVRRGVIMQGLVKGKWKWHPSANWLVWHLLQRVEELEMKAKLS